MIIIHYRVRVVRGENVARRIHSALDAPSYILTSNKDDLVRALLHPSKAGVIQV